MSEERSLAYHRARPATVFPAALAAAVLDEAVLQLPPAGVDALLRAAGARLAVETPIPACTSFAELEAAVCRALRQLDWGWAEIQDGDGVVLIRHHEHPTLASLPAAEETAAARLLEGLYTAWLKGLGSEGGLVALASPPDLEARVIELRFGRPDRIVQGR